MENTGRGLTKAKDVINVGDDFQKEFEVDTFVPRTSIAYPIKWTADASDGEYPTRVEITYGERTATWEGHVQRRPTGARGAGRPEGVSCRSPQG